MGLIRKLRSSIHGDWCGRCQIRMDVEKKQLYALPDAYVGHYTGSREADYYKKHLVRVEKKAEISTGTYACGLHVYRCSKCGGRTVKLTVFLPVRDEEKLEQIIYFKNGEMNDFIWE